MNLKEARSKLKITQKKLEELSGVKQATISKIELRSGCSTSIDIACKLIKGLEKAGLKNARLENIFYDSIPPNPQSPHVSDAPKT